MEKTLYVDTSKCVGCRICEQWCSFSHGKFVSEDNSRVKMVKDHRSFSNVPLICRQCAEPLCVKGCPTKALSKNEVTGAVMVNEEKCVGCRKCTRTCPYGAVHYVARIKKVRICDLCNGNPQCVSHCPMGAILYLDTNAAEDLYREQVARQMGGLCNE